MPQLTALGSTMKRVQILFTTYMWLEPRISQRPPSIPAFRDWSTFQASALIRNPNQHTYAPALRANMQCVQSFRMQSFFVQALCLAETEHSLAH